MNQIEAGKIVVHSYLNASPYDRLHRYEIVIIEFASNEDTDAQFFASILLEVKADTVEKTGQATGTITIPASTSGGTATTQDESFALTWRDDGDAVIQVTYIINDNVLTTYYPIETWKSGKHILESLLSALRAYGKYLQHLPGLAENDRRFRFGRACTGYRHHQRSGTFRKQGLGWPFGILRHGGAGALQRLEICRLYGGGEHGVDNSDTSRLPDSLPLFRAGGLSITAFTDTAKVDPVVVTETINVADKRKMAYSEVYSMKVTDKFELQTAYAYKSAEGTIDEGRMCRLTVNTEQFASVTGLEVKNG